MSRSIAVDIGGTFTDCITVDGEGRRVAAKALTTPGSLERGVLDAVDLTAEKVGASRAELLGETDRFVHGTTQATNALVTRSGARTGFITTKGHEDTLIIGRVYSKVAGLAERQLVHASRLSKPDPLVPRALTRGVTERVDREGEAVVALDEDEAGAAIDELLEAGVEAIAVSLLWSFLEPAHELRIAELIAERSPRVHVSCSHEIAPVIGEYERAASTVVDAYVGPTVVGYLRELERTLRAEGLGHPLLVMQANGGLTSVADAAQRPIVTLDSGPTGGVLGCAHLGGIYTEENVICTDVGGTTFDVGVILAGEVPLTDEPVVARHTLKLPKVDVEAIGAGGGSIAWIDDGGVLQVGPESAGSVPGPACYGRGGERATVTDADLVLGYLDPDAFLGGEMKLDRSLALEALEGLGRQLGLTPEEVGAGIFRIVNAQMADLISKATISRGHDPRDCVLVSYGGAGPTHAAFYGEDLAVKEILIPADSTVFSAEGMLTCDIVHAASRSRQLQSPFSAEDLLRLGADLDDLQRQVTARFEVEGVAETEVELRRSVGMRFRNQVISLDVELPAGKLHEAAAARLIEEFHRRYARLFGEGAMLRNAGVEIDLHRVAGTLPIEPVRFPERSLADPDPSAARIGRRRVFFESAGFLDTDVFAGERLLAGHRIEGPAIVQRMGDSVVVPAGCVATVDARLTLRLAWRARDTSPPAGENATATTTTGVH